MTEAELSFRDTQALDAAKLYYAGMKQADVAKRLSVSRSTISKLLAHAQRRGFVRIEILDPRERDETLLATLQNRFGLLDIRLINPPRGTEAQLRAELGAAGAELLHSLVRDGDLLGVVPSRTIAEIVHHLDYQPRRNIDIVEISRGLAHDRTNSDHSRTLTMLANAFGARLHSIPVPLFAPSIPEKNRTVMEPEVRRALRLGSEARIALFTVGDIPSNRMFIEDGAMPAGEKLELIRRACGDLCSRFIDVHGRICLPDLNNRTIGISLSELRAKDQRILVAGGPSKVRPIRAALANGYVNRLVIDVPTARAVIALDDELRAK